MTYAPQRSILDPLRRARKGQGIKPGQVFTGYIRPLLEDCPKLRGSNESFKELVKEWHDKDYVESFKVVFLNRANYMVAIDTISTGGVSGCVADPKVIFQKALAANASGMILAHNHPSGNSTPSQADIDLTKKLQAGGRLLEIQVLDHIIVCGDHSYYSFADEGLI